jgi:hypothetical protein
MNNRLSLHSFALSRATSVSVEQVGQKPNWNFLADLNHLFLVALLPPLFRLTGLSIARWSIIIDHGFTGVPIQSPARFSSIRTRHSLNHTDATD